MTTPPPSSDWLARWRETNSDIARLSFTHRMADAVIDEQRGRDIRIGEQWLAQLVADHRQPGAVRADRGAARGAVRHRGRSDAAHG